METCFERHIQDSPVNMPCIYSSHRLKSKSFRESTYYQIIKVPSDGHCMIHAWKIALEYSREMQNKPSYEQLYNSIYYEFTKNKDFYRNFVSDIVNVEKEVLEYLQHRNFASEVGDLVLQALANVTGIYAIIYTENGEGSPAQSCLVQPTNGQRKGLINLLKRDQHYDVIILGKIGETT